MFQPFDPIAPVGCNQQSSQSSVPFSFDKESEGPEQGPSFGSLFSQALGGVNDSIIEVGGLIEKAATGDTQNIHEITLKGAEAQVLLKLATSISSKVTSAATTLFQMQL